MVSRCLAQVVQYGGIQPKPSVHISPAKNLATPYEKGEVDRC